jgi:hypothetical protein
VGRNIERPVVGLGRSRIRLIRYRRPKSAFQQRLPKFDIAVILLRTKTNRLADLEALVPDLVAALSTAKKGAATQIGL